MTSNILTAVWGISHRLVAEVCISNPSTITADDIPSLMVCNSDHDGRDKHLWMLTLLQKRVPLEVGLLRLFYALIQRVDESSLAECWPLLLSLLKDGLQMNLTAPAVFLLLMYYVSY